MQGECDYDAFCQACPTYSEELAAGPKYVEWEYVHRYSQRERRGLQRRETDATAKLQCRHRSRVYEPETVEAALATITARVQDMKRGTGNRLAPGEAFVSQRQRPVWRPDIESGDRKHIAMIRKFYAVFK